MMQKSKKRKFVLLLGIPEEIVKFISSIALNNDVLFSYTFSNSFDAVQSSVVEGIFWFREKTKVKFLFQYCLSFFDDDNL